MARRWAKSGMPLERRGRNVGERVVTTRQRGVLLSSNSGAGSHRNVLTIQTLKRISSSRLNFRLLFQVQISSGSAVAAPSPTSPSEPLPSCCVQLG